MATKKYICGKCKQPFRTKPSLDKHQRENCNGLQTQAPTIIDANKQKIQKRIEELSKKFDWIRIANDGVTEIFADHHILSTFRTCEAKFEEEIVNNIIPRTGNWSLSFGIAFHKWMEWFDEAEDKNFKGKWNDSVDISSGINGKTTYYLSPELHEITITNWIARCKNYWRENNLDQFRDQPGFKDLEGWNGAQLLLMQYWNRYGNGQERLRTVGSELGFGKNREVPILLNPNQYPWAPFRCYLTGRIDRVVDNGRVIGPLDRKTHRYFKGKEASKYKPHDGFLGYVYAIDTILGSKFKEQNKSCNSVIVDLVALKEPTEKTKNKVRFIRAARDFSPSEIEAFKRRQVSTFAQIYEVLVLGRAPQWNTIVCHNQYYKDCPYKVLHEASEECRVNLINSFYMEREERWSPYRNEREQQQEEALVE